MSEAPRAWQAEVGLCSLCVSGQPQPSARGHTYWRCLRADSEPAFLRYPPLPVGRCPGFEGLPDAQLPG